MVTFTGSDLQINNPYKCGSNRIPPKKSNIVTLSRKKIPSNSVAFFSLLKAIKNKIQL